MRSNVAPGGGGGGGVSCTIRQGLWNIIQVGGVSSVGIYSVVSFLNLTGISEETRTSAAFF
jgi:hypothetical protein